MATVADLRLATAENLRWAQRDLTEFFGAYAGADPIELRDALLEFYPDFVQVYGEQGAELAAEFYDEARAAALASGQYRASLAPPVPQEQAVGVAKWAIGPAFEDNWDSALQQLVGASTRLIQQQGRDTMRWNVDRDPTAVGWRRETRAGSCQFCRMLADRGGVYSKKSAYFAAHDNCRCVVAPSWDQSARRSRVPDFKTSERTSRMKPAQREAAKRQVKQWLADNADKLT
ncbi:hypothetical protein JD276_14085 [Leucobacter sp. CSA1]|uniref:MuF-like minor capsid protein n=1 Tax=Leucobacter chromiisoli TaxID=2796471 RepID=A0A934Q9T3_9MICO|nr:hypothetical protein [Leucobacter chromiisoli]MBK0420163.1 hypothetical protein [Leucobacter chromiisoli]